MPLTEGLRGARLGEMFVRVPLFGARPLHERLCRRTDGDELARELWALAPADRDRLLYLLQRKYLPATADTADKEDPALLPEPSSPYWEFGLVGGCVMARAIGGASLAGLANGRLGRGAVAPGTTIDVTCALPAWVGTVLSEQASTGVIFHQKLASSSPDDGHVGKYELGEGNCHGFTFHFFELYREQEIESFEARKEDGTTERTGSPPAGTPRAYGEFPPRYQLAHLHHDGRSKQPVTARAFQHKFLVGGVRWVAFLEVGRDVLVADILRRGGKVVRVPRFGDLGIKHPKGGFDHSAIALGRRGSTHVYLLQKDAPGWPYFVNLVQVSRFDWYRR